MLQMKTGGRISFAWMGLMLEIILRGGVNQYYQDN